MNLRNERDANRALAETPRGLSTTRWRERGELLELGARWYFWVGLVMSVALAVARFA